MKLKAMTTMPIRARRKRMMDFLEEFAKMDSDVCEVIVDIPSDYATIYGAARSLGAAVKHYGYAFEVHVIDQHVYMMKKK